jgi:hypothetical protein
VKKIASAILLFAFFGQTFNQGFYYISYLINKAEYVKKCENKSRPQMNCNGQCLLMKRIKQQEKNEQGQAPEMKLAAKAEVLSSKSSFLLNTPEVITFANKTYSLFNFGMPIDQPSSYFHPPDCKVDFLI